MSFLKLPDPLMGFPGHFLCGVHEGRDYEATDKKVLACASISIAM